MTQVPHIFDAARLVARRHRAARRALRPGIAYWLGEALAEDVSERLGFLRWDGSRALVAGLSHDRVAAELRQHTGEVIEHDSLELDAPIAGGPFDLIVSLAELDTVNDLPGALIHLRHALAPGGLLIAMLVGGGSLPVLRAAMLAADGERPAGRIHPQVDARAASGLLQRAGFSRQAVDSHTLTVRYRSLRTLVADLRDQGLGSALADRAAPLGKAALARAEAAFAARAEADGKVSERFEIVTLTAWRD